MYERKDDCETSWVGDETNALTWVQEGCSNAEYTREATCTSNGEQWTAEACTYNSGGGEVSEDVNNCKNDWFSAGKGEVPPEVWYVPATATQDWTNNKVEFL